MYYFIGICGGSGAGKTFLANKLKAYYGDSLTIINYDSYCLSKPNLTKEELGRQNYDIPEAYDAALVYKQMKELKSGYSIELPHFDFTIHKRTNETTHIEPNIIVVIEGIMVFQVQKLLPLLNLKVFVDAKEDIRFARRLKRDVAERGRTEESVYRQFREFVKPMHDIYIEPMKSIADIVVTNNENSGEIDKLPLLVELIDKNLSF